MMANSERHLGLHLGVTGIALWYNPAEFSASRQSEPTGLLSIRGLSEQAIQVKQKSPPGLIHNLLDRAGQRR
jgi:hypothetical protein